MSELPDTLEATRERDGILYQAEKMFLKGFCCERAQAEALALKPEHHGAQQVCELIKAAYDAMQDPAVCAKVAVLHTRRCLLELRAYEMLPKCDELLVRLAGA